MMEGTEATPLPEEDILFQKTGLRWYVGFRQIPSNIPIGSVEAEIKTVSTRNGIYVLRRLLLRPKLRQNKIVEIQAELYPLCKFKEILKAEVKRLSYIKDCQDEIAEAKSEINSCSNGLSRISWLLSQKERETVEISEEIQFCKNHLGILRKLIAEAEKNNG